MIHHSITLKINDSKMSQLKRLRNQIDMFIRRWVKSLSYPENSVFKLELSEYNGDNIITDKVSLRISIKDKNEKKQGNYLETLSKK